MNLPGRTRSRRRPAFHGGRRDGVPAQREPAYRTPLPSSDSAGHGEDAGRQEEGAPPREDRAG
jgi:hypothetical protein